MKRKKGGSEKKKREEVKRKKGGSEKKKGRKKGRLNTWSTLSLGHVAYALITHRSRGRTDLLLLQQLAWSTSSSTDLFDDSGVSSNLGHLSWTEDKNTTRHLHRDNKQGEKQREGKRK